MSITISGVILDSELEKIKKILVPYDDSKYAKNAFNLACNFAQQFKAELTIVTVLDSSIMRMSFIDLNDAEMRKEKEGLLKIKKSFHLLKQEAMKHGIPVKTIIKVSSLVSESIVQIASVEKTDLIIMGTRSSRSLPKFTRLGSAAMDVLQKTNCPVLFAK